MMRLLTLLFLLTLVLTTTTVNTPDPVGSNCKVLTKVEKKVDIDYYFKLCNSYKWSQFPSMEI